VLFEHTHIGIVPLDNHPRNHAYGNRQYADKRKQKRKEEV
jgi:hypothetical protein